MLTIEKKITFTCQYCLVFQEPAKMSLSYIKYSILYAKYYIYLEKLKDNNKL